MAQINEWLSIDKANGSGDATITLTASSSTELTERMASLEIRGITKSVYINITQNAYVAPSVNDNFWVKLDEDGDIQGLRTTFEYSYDQRNWNSCPTTLSVPADTYVWFRNTSPILNATNASTILFTERGIIGGDLSSMGDMRESNFRELFAENVGLVDASELLLPWDRVVNRCFYNMFNGCINLLSPPELPATELEGACYIGMFSGCESLNIAPVLPATTLSFDPNGDTYGCYQSMFSGCISLMTAPTLPATILVNKCYMNMFFGCTSLMTAPSLPAISLANSCYQGMFFGCTLLPKTPSLPATTIPKNAYLEMFRGCTRLTTISHIGATDLSEADGMFRECTSLTEFEVSEWVTDMSSNDMFNGCTNLKTIIVHPSTAPTITDYTFRGIAENGALVNSTGSDYSSWLSTNTYRLGYYGWDTRIPLKADNKIFYDGTIGIDESVFYGTNGVYVRSGQEDGMKYLEYDRPITEICKFNNVSGLKKLILPSTLLYINKEFCYDVSTLTEVVFGGNEIYIGDMAFGSCENLNKYDLPLSVAYIGVCALGGTSKAVNMGAESIWFGANLQEVRGAAFSGCYNTKDVYFLGYTPPVFYTMTNYETYGSFQDMRAVFHIPAGSKTDYENAVKPYTDLGISFNFVEDIPSGEKINYGESGILTGSENNVIPPKKNRVIGWWNKTEEHITFGTYGNITNTSYSSKTVETTKGGFQFTYEVLGNGVDVSPNMSGWKNSKTYFYRLEYNPTGLSNLRFSTDPTLTFSSESVENGVYTRTYYTTSALTATNWVSIILEGDDKFGSHLKLRMTLDSYDALHETVQEGWS